MKKLIIVLVMVSAMIFAGFFSGFSYGGKSIVSERAVGTIRINNDTDLASFAQSGSGTANSPYVLEYLNIDAHGSGDAIYIGNTTKYFVIRNSYLYNGSYGVHLYNVTNARIENNVIMNMNSTTSANMGIFLDKYCSNIVVKGNTIMSITGHGVAAYMSNKIYVENNTIVNCQQYGIYFYLAPNGKISFNTVEGNQVGIWLYYSDYGKVADNTVQGNSWYGIVLYSSHWDYVNRNRVEESGHIGISLYSLSDNTTSNNTITGNLLINNTGYGVDAGDYSFNNLIYNNAFYFNNGTTGSYNSANIQAYDQTGKNLWNNTTIGNYWYDWANNNASNDPDGNGIVNWPYVIAGAGDYDYFPLKYGAPTYPQNLTALSGDGYVNISWKAPFLNGGQGIVRYNVYRNGILIANVSSSQLWYNDTSVSGGQTYTYYVTAVNPVEESVSSNKVSATPTGSVPEFSQIIWLGVLLLSLALWRRR